MPEGPSILILKELAAPFRGKKVIAVAGNSKVEKERALGEVVTDFKSWGKHFLICFRRFAIKIHLMLFGSYRINEDRDTPSRLTLKFRSGFINFYACSVTILDQNLDEIYDWSADVMSDQWDPKAAKKKLQAQPSLMACDALLDQNIFAGSGNIIKNEVLFRIKVHPKSLVGALPTRQINQLIKQVRVYSFDFLNWKKAYVLRKHWLVHNKSTCARCERPLTREYLGRFHRRTFYCSHCQILYE